MVRNTILLVMLFILGVYPATAEELDFNLIQLSSGAEINVENDVMVVVLEATSQANDAGTAASKVNADMEWALARVEKKKQVNKQTRNYHTYPQYKNSVIIGWQVKQTLMLESTDMEALRTLTGTLQERLHIQSMQFRLHQGTKKQMTRGVIEAALERFREKAVLVQKSMGAGEYRIVKLQIFEGDQQPVYSRAFQMDGVAAARVSEPAVAGGDARVSVNIDGTIQLVY